MAKRRKEKDEEEEDKPFKIPKFDEKSFLKRERRNIKATFISAILGVLIAIVCFGFWVLMGSESSMRWPLVLLVGIANAAFLKYIFLRINLDLEDFTNKNWFTSFAFYFFVWLLVFIILVNPPIYDEEAPKVDLVILPNWQEPGGTVIIAAKITDNSGICKDNINFELTNPEGQTTNPSFTFEDNIFYYEHIGPDSLSEDKTYNFKLTVEDNANNKYEKSDSFTYSTDTIKLATPNTGTEVDAVTDIKFEVNADVNAVYYKVDNGERINTTQDDLPRIYKTYPRYEGWPEGGGKTVKIKVYAVKKYYFENYRDEDGKSVPFSNKIVDSDTYELITDSESSIGRDPDPKVSLPKPRFVQAPGFELIVFIASIAIIGIIFKHKKKNRSKQK